LIAGSTIVSISKRCTSLAETAVIRFLCDLISGLLFISVHISFVLFSPGSVEADVGGGGKLNSRLIASCFRNTCDKNH